MQSVLIIDDDPFILELLQEYLTQEGFVVVTAPDGRAGLAAFDRETPSVVLCDLTMPGLGGLGVLAEVKRRSPLTPFVVFSGTSDLALAVEALRQGAWDYLLKPLPGLELLPPLLGRMAERSALLAEKERAQVRLEEEVKVRTAQLVRQLKEKDLLLSEVHHRVKNNLQIILVLLGLQEDHAVHPLVKQTLDVARNRIHALALVQDEMHDADHAALVNAGAYLTGLVQHLLGTHGITSRVDLSLAVEPLELTPSQSFACGLVLNELMAALAAEPSEAPWSLSLGLRAIGRGSVLLTLRESRGTWSRWVPAPGRSSLGWETVSALAATGGGSLEWSQTEPEVVTVRLS